MSPQDVLLGAIDPANALLARLTRVQSDDRARVLMLAIAGQEARWLDRRQFGCYTPGVYQAIGARGLWQCERLGAVYAAMQACPTEMKAVCAALSIPFDIYDIYEAIAWHDVLAASIARLTLWQDPAPLPDVGQVSDGWNYYIRNWRPGLPHLDTWAGRYGTAQVLVANNPLRQVA